MPREPANRIHERGHVYSGPRGFLEPRESREFQSGEKRKTSGYPGLECHFHADASCQTRQIDNYNNTNTIIQLIL